MPVVYSGAEDDLCVCAGRFYRLSPIHFRNYLLSGCSGNRYSRPRGADGSYWQA